MSHFRFLFVAAFASLGLLGACATSSTEEVDAGTPDAGGETGLNCGAATKCGLGAATKCADLTKDPANCGACGKACTAGQFCAGSKCADACNSPFKLCGQFCVNVDTDHDNCGSCGKGCTAEQDCIAKACVKKCALGLTPCGDTCANLTSDHDFCGDCNTACGMTENCSGGICCAAGQTSCMGQCVDLQYSNDNCGVCGFACGGQTPYCVNGKCSTCNPSVLLLMDQDGSADNQKLATALGNLGIPTVLKNFGIEQYNGTPDASTFGAIVVSAGDDSFMNNDMPNSGQQAIVAAQQKGIGIVLVEPLQYNNYYQSYLQTLSALFLVNGNSDEYFQDDGPPWPKITKTANHAIWTGVTAPVDLNPVYYAYTMQSTKVGSATVIGQCSAQYTSGTACNGAGIVLVKATTGGRVAHFNATMNDSSFGSWSANASIVKLMTNAVQWASNCQ